MEAAGNAIRRNLVTYIATEASRPVPLCSAQGRIEPHVAPSVDGCYTRVVKSVASSLRERDAADVRGMTPEERLALAFRLGDEELESFRATHGLDRTTAIRLLERRRQATRQPSACLERLIG